MRFIVFTVLILLYNCSPYLPTSSTAEVDKTILIQVECRNEQQVATSAIQALKLVRINDLEKEDHGNFIVIKARYKELPPHKGFEIKDRLFLIPGILDVQFMKDGIPVKNIF